MNFVTIRSGLSNSFQTFRQKKTGRVVCLGGSITVAEGWRVLIWKFLQKSFPRTKFDFINAGIGGTDSTFGAMRLKTDVFKNGPVDLLFLEFAVNDEGQPALPVLRAMEGIIRQARKLNPKIDIPMLYFADQEKMESYNAGKMTPTLETHEKVAHYYNLSTLNLAREIHHRIAAGEFSWEKFSSDSCHPTAFGHALYAQAIKKFLKTLWTIPSPALTPRKPLDPFNYQKGRFIPITKAKVKTDWTRIKNWETAEQKCNYSGPVDILEAQKPGATLTLDFTGSAIGISAICGFDAGMVTYRIDNKKSITFDFFDSYCLKFHRPVHHLLAADLPPGRHTLTLQITKQKNPKSRGHVLRILKFTAN